MSNADIVQKIYEAFGNSDIDSVLAPLAEDIVWDDWHGGNAAVDDGVAYLAARKGKDEVAGFFRDVMQSMTFNGFQPLGILEGGNQVAAVIRIDATINATGKRFQDDELHLWTFDEAGKVTGLRHFIDTHKHVRANT